MFWDIIIQPRSITIPDRNCDDIDKKTFSLYQSYHYDEAVQKMLGCGDQKKVLFSCAKIYTNQWEVFIRAWLKWAHSPTISVPESFPPRSTASFAILYTITHSKILIYCDSPSLTHNGNLAILMCRKTEFLSPMYADYITPTVYDDLNGPILREECE